MPVIVSVELLDLHQTFKCQGGDGFYRFPGDDEQVQEDVQQVEALVPDHGQRRVGGHVVNVFDDLGQLPHRPDAFIQALLYTHRGKPQVIHDQGVADVHHRHHHDEAVDALGPDQLQVFVEGQVLGGAVDPGDVLALVQYQVLQPLRLGQGVDVGVKDPIMQLLAILEIVDQRAHLWRYTLGLVCHFYPFKSS